MEASMKMEARMTANRPQRMPEPPAITITPAISEEEIRARAYEIYLDRNGEPGDPVQDWLRAEAELSQPKLSMTQVA
jgi:hypothetical protein